DIRTIPVVGLDELKKPEKERRKHALISAGRLAPEKRMNQVIKAAAEAKKDIPDLSLDIYGEGGERENLQELIDTLGCGDCVRLCGFRKL
ncbi:glycosyltransferase, partial [Klebsiella pneumoniae]|uniref:glycosyltransferase n=1 Tax=Klebsiella pneumoniae TaxID=573 RepID=UPI0027316F3E